MLYIFDWDGTLVNSVDRIVLCLGKAAQELALPLLENHQYQEIIGLGLHEAIHSLYPDADADMHTAMRDAYSKHFVNEDVAPCPFFPGVVETLQTLHEEGHKLAVATGKSRRGLNRVLEQLNWDSYFHSTRCADETLSKPHPLMIEQILEELNMPRHQAVMIGDTEFDLEMARNAGVASIGVSYGAHSAERLEKSSPLAIVNHFGDLIEVMKEAG
jgi:phosphoglycolate phosphatase